MTLVQLEFFRPFCDNGFGVGLAGLLDWSDNPNLPGSTPGRSTPLIFRDLTSCLAGDILVLRLSVQSISKLVRCTKSASADFLVALRTDPDGFW